MMVDAGRRQGGYSYLDRHTLLNPYSKEELRNAIRFLEMTLEMINHRRKSSDTDYNKMESPANLLDGVEEMSKLGRSLGINQGMPTDLYSIRNAIKNISEFTGNFDISLLIQHIDKV